MPVKNRCLWPKDDALMLEYHDKEWGKPLHDDRSHFEFLILDLFQAGLSWQTILRKRKNFEKAFGKFDPKKISKYDRKKIKSLMQNQGIVRNSLKIKGAIQNAKAFLKVQKEFGSFDKFIWQFTNQKTKKNKWKKSNEIPAKTEESENMSKELKKRGFTFIGPTICYAYMQAAGIVDDHLVRCFRHKK